MATFDAQILQRRDTAANWTSANPTLNAGEVGYESELGKADKMKIGDGLTAWIDLPYAYATLDDNTFTGVQNWAHGDNIASASTVNLDNATGNFVDITGTTQINLITLADGASRVIRFNGILTLKNSDKLQLLGNANIITADGDIAVFIGDAANAAQMVSYSRADGKALKETTSDNGKLWKHGLNITAASTINLTNATGDYVNVTGRTSISSITLADGIERKVRFVSPLSLIHDPANIDLPGKADIAVTPGDIVTFIGDKAGVVRVVSYSRADGTALVGSSETGNNGNDLLWVHGASITSASTINLTNATGDYIYVTGNTPVNFITLANGQERTVSFSQSLTITHNPSAINCPGNADIVTEAGDIVVFRGDSAGRVRIVSYTRDSGKALVESANAPFFDSVPLIKGSVNPTKKVRFEVDGLTADTVRKITVPDKDFTLAGIDDIEAIVTTGAMPVPDTVFIAKGLLDNTKRVRFEVDELLDTGAQITLKVPNRDITLAGLDDLADLVSGISLPIPDTTALIKGSADPTKKIKFQIGGLSTGATRVLTVPDKDFTIAGIDDIHEIGLGFTSNSVLNPTISPYEITTSGDVAVMVPSGGAFTVKLNATPNEGNINVIFAPLDADTNNVTIQTNGHPVNGSAADLIMTVPNSTSTFIFDAMIGEWRESVIISDVPGAELLVNKVTSVSSASTDTEYPSAKLFYDQLLLKLDAADFNDYFVGAYANLTALQTAHPTSSSGQYAFVDAGIGADAVQYIWDVDEGWVPGTASGSIASTDALSEGSSNLYFTGARAIAAVLTGFTSGAGAVSSSDTILQALQKIVGNIAALSAFTASSMDTLTNKRITNRVGGTTSSATPTINTDNVDVYKLSAQAVDITSFTTNLSGTPTDTQFLEIVITGTAARAITWGSSFVSSTITLPTTTVSTNTMRVTLQYDSTISKWVCVGVA